jgi:hypothetical protein
MNEEDEAFEDLAKRQGDWGMQGSRKHQILRYAENVESKGTSTTQEEIDIMWQQAMRESIKDGQMYTRYHFAKLVAKRALAEHAMREVQRLGQEIEQEKALQALHDENERLGLYKDAYAQPEQEPVAWMWDVNNGGGYTSKGIGFMQTNIPFAKHTPLYAHPPQRTEQNFCSRCGKRTPDLITIHTCTPPKENA